MVGGASTTRYPLLKPGDVPGGGEGGESGCLGWSAAKVGIFFGCRCQCHYTCMCPPPFLLAPALWRPSLTSSAAITGRVRLKNAIGLGLVCGGCSRGAMVRGTLVMRWLLGPTRARPVPLSPSSVVCASALIGIRIQGSRPSKRPPPSPSQQASHVIHTHVPPPKVSTKEEWGLCVCACVVSLRRASCPPLLRAFWLDPAAAPDPQGRPVRPFPPFVNQPAIWDDGGHPCQAAPFVCVRQCWRQGETRVGLN